jgi:hypothetical protein
VQTDLPRLVVIKRLLDQRYANGVRPADWDQRREGLDAVESVEGEKINLLSDGSQSSPKEGWSIVLTAGDSHAGYRWTLYSLGSSVV